MVAGGELGNCVAPPEDGIRMVDGIGTDDGTDVIDSDDRICTGDWICTDDGIVTDEVDEVATTVRREVVTVEWLLLDVLTVKVPEEC